MGPERYLFVAGLLVALVLSIIHLVHATALAFARPKYRRLQARDFPGIPSDKFEEWRRLELRSIDIFLWATWGLLAIGAVIAIFVVAPAVREAERRRPGWFKWEELAVLGAYLVSYLVYFVLSLVGLAISNMYESRAKRLKKSLGIHWPGKV